MNPILPVNVSASALVAGRPSGEPSIAAQETTTSTDLAPTIPEPPKPDELAMWQQESYQLDAQFAASVGFPLWSVDSKNDLQVMLFGISRYQDIRVSSQTYRFGVAIRVLLEIFDCKQDAKLSLPAIAAQVELGIVQANSQVIVSGYAGNIGASLPNWQAFDVNAYSDYVKEVNNLKDVVFGDVANTRPTLLSTSLANDLPNAERSRSGAWHRFLDHF